MIFFLTTQPIWVSGAIIVGLGTLLSVLGTVLVRRYANVKRLTPDTEIAGFKFGTIGVLYAVLLAFAIIVVWEKYSDAELDVVQEAGAAENIYRLSQGLSDDARVAVLHSVANYLKAAISVDWPTMDQGITSTRAARVATKQALDAVYAALVSSSGQGDSTVVSEMLRQVDLIPPRAAGPLRGCGAKGPMADSARRSGHHDRLHVLLRHAKADDAGLNDNPACNINPFRTPDYNRHRPAFQWGGQDRAKCTRGSACRR